MREIDAAAVRAGASTRALMENAGFAVAREAVKRFSPRPTAVLCGPGDNGGDGWVAARALQELGWPVWVETLVRPDQLKGAAAQAAADWTGPVYVAGEHTPTAELFIDALFGAGLSRPLEGEAARLAAALKAMPERVIAVDVPSGLHGDSAAPLGDAYVRAALTVTFVRKKPAHVLMPGRALCGQVVCADIGVPPQVMQAMELQTRENGPDQWRLPWPSAMAHKHARGHAMVASGGAARTGAARLAARAALRVGAGLVTVLSPPDALAENAAHLTAVMLREATDADALVTAIKDAKALVIGPAFGVSDAHGARLTAVLAAPERCPMVLDADAITLLSPLSRKLDPRDVMTPHLGEFRRAFPDLLQNVVNRIEAARAAAAHAGCVVLLKGPDTVIATSDGRALVNTTGTPFLATAGSGDVLAGLIGGLMAQGLDSFDAAGAGAWLHGKTAEMLGPGLVAEDLPEKLPHILNELYRDFRPLREDRPISGD